MNKNEVSITGMGFVSCLGHEKETFLNALKTGQSGISSDSGYKLNDKEIPAGIVPELPYGDFFDINSIRRHGRLSKFALMATHQALSDAGLSEEEISSETTGLFYITSHSVINYNERFLKTVLKKPAFASPMYFSNSVFNAPSSHISLAFKMKGPAFTLGGESSATVSVIETAQIMINTGALDKALIVGGNETSDVMFQAYHDCGLIRDNGSGITLGEGAGAIVLEKNKKGYGSIPGFGRKSSFNENTDKRGEALFTAMNIALTGANLKPENIAFVSGSKSGFPLLDNYEAMAVNKLNKNIPIRSVKSLIGELFGGTVLFQIGEALLSMKEKTPPEVNNVLISAVDTADFRASMVVSNNKKQ